jgi:hypothetical protein
LKRSLSLFLSLTILVTNVSFASSQTQSVGKKMVERSLELAQLSDAELDQVLKAELTPFAYKNYTEAQATGRKLNFEEFAGQFSGQANFWGSWCGTDNIIFAWVTVITAALAIDASNDVRKKKDESKNLRVPIVYNPTHWERKILEAQIDIDYYTAQGARPDSELILNLRAEIARYELAILQDQRNNTLNNQQRLRDADQRLVDADRAENKAKVLGVVTILSLGLWVPCLLK